ncbi:hypothetical protein JCM6292_1299 [Bacteroides pyogenes JCM 6292]|uniref:Uncharacterized protein n=2 Tax=Bacteroides pyogenes TaxID=310300 RepID=W4PHW4_9BACE|nr:hypothetical protein JCM6292_1299 [Bacteroides pyogenes JCM 6292]GAE18744.1 hypothetical protein JCM6294_1689 [Bacteroides pyogenes DSM 20611 = JCM 6294]
MQTQPLLAANRASACCKQSLCCMKANLMKMGMDYRIAVNRASIACKHSLCLRQTEPL